MIDTNIKGLLYTTMAVLPLLDSVTVQSASTSPARSAASIIARAIRSLTLPSGLKYSHLTYTAACSGATSRRKRTIGVCPTSSSIDAPARDARRVGCITGYCAPVPGHLPWPNPDPAAPEGLETVDKKSDLARLRRV